MPMFKVTCKWNGKPWEKDIEAENEADCTEHMYLFGVLIGKADIQDLQLTEIKEKKTMSGHPHADLMAKAAEIAKTDYWWNEHFEIYAGEKYGWIEMSLSSSFIREEEYRLKPRFIDINGHEVPEPVREPLQEGDLYYVASTADGLFSATWDCGCIDSERLRAGIIHLTDEAAEAHIAALLSFTQK